MTRTERTEKSDRTERLLSRHRLGESVHLSVFSVVSVVSVLLGAMI